MYAMIATFTEGDGWLVHEFAAVCEKPEDMLVAVGHERELERDYQNPPESAPMIRSLLPDDKHLICPKYAIGIQKGGEWRVLYEFYSVEMGELISWPYEPGY